MISERITKFAASSGVGAMMVHVILKYNPMSVACLGENNWIV